ncbi:HNH endonuclease family protein [Alloscardovia omnicolens]|uniref:HNH endonuclease family protein n=1 Tax=Alloscardovia omnicolens TaxID=419015 RepID=UPI003A6BEB8D
MTRHYRRRRTRARRAVVRVKAQWYYLMCAIVLLGILVGSFLPQVSDTVARTTGTYTATGQAAEALERLAVVDHPRTSRQYKRDYFGFRQTDEDGNGCDVREDVLARDLQDVRYKSLTSCKVATGILHDPYTGKTIHFQRGIDTSKAVQIDHVVALSNAWKSGAYKWNTARRYEFGNDTYNLLAVDGPANQQKEDASADQWLPSNSAYACQYVARQIGVKTKYQLSVTSAEKESMLKVLHGCANQTLPAR